MSGKQKGCQGKDAFQRMNFLYQAATMMAGKNDVLSCYYGSLCKSVGRKAVLKMEPAIKRTICKRCGIILRPGVTADIIIEQKNTKFCLISCLKCNYKKQYQINANYKLWLDNPASVVEECNFGEASNSNQIINKTNFDKKFKEKHNKINNEMDVEHYHENVIEMKLKCDQNTSVNKTELDENNSLFSQIVKPIDNHMQIDNDCDKFTNGRQTS